MLTFPNISPNIIEFTVPFLNRNIGISWYGLMYVIGFMGFYFGSLNRAKRFGWSETEVSDYLNYIIFGVVLGGRIGYCVFPYGFAKWQQDWTYIFRIWEGGMSFHGGLIGVIVATYLFARSRQKRFLAVGDFVAMTAAIGLGTGRLGNFINGELWGRVTDVPWGMVFPTGGNVPRHPSQLYEAFLEGLVLFIILWCYTAKDRPLGKPSGLFLMLYGAFRILVEFFREPDAHLNYYLGTNWLTMGQILSVPMVLLGVYLFFRQSSQQSTNQNTNQSALLSSEETV